MLAILAKLVDQDEANSGPNKPSVQSSPTRLLLKAEVRHAVEDGSICIGICR